MKLDQLAYFVEAARLESVGKAARSLAISPSAISTSVRALERELGCALFAREKQRIHLTAEGRALVPRAEAILASVERLGAELSGPELAFEAKSTIACARVLAPHVGADWADLHAEHPRLSVELQTLRSVEIVAKAATAEIDLGIALDPRPHPEVESRVLGRSRYAVAVRAGHPVVRSPRARLLHALADLPACMPRSFTRAGGYEAHPGLERLGVRPRVDFAYDSYDVVLPRLRGSNAWVLYPMIFGSAPAKGITLVPLPGGEIPMVIAAVWPRRRALGRALGILAERIERRLRG